MNNYTKLHSISVQKNPKFFAENFLLPPTSVLNLPNCWITSETLRDFLFNCKANLEYLRWQSFDNIQLFVDIVEDYGRMKGKEIKYGNWIWKQFRNNVVPITLDV
ncbi:hypothetical protein C2G38_2208550 [Gigaspora rosea]|uniref:Uncharacterized protein n=1 Tax=Gigaspora rosea TaxID=44941 RepID=A0A397UHB5_9GLOM|nr:hypothetical protein C2G38_2208550 [Gigaspora rosea]